MKLYFECAGISYELSGDIPEMITEDVAPFFSFRAEKGYTRIYCRLKKVQSLNVVSGISMYRDPFRWVLNNEGNEYRIFFMNEHRNPYAIFKEISHNQIEIEYLPFVFPAINMRFVELFSLEKALMKNNAFLLHGCYIRYHDKSIVFTAPSGTGKSTQGNLWVQYEDAEVINGDRCVIQKKENGYYACGIPFCGSSMINRNLDLPILAIVVVRQAKVDQVNRLQGVEAAKLIMSETSINHWNVGFVNQTISLIEDLMDNIKILQLDCTISPNAVDVLKKELLTYI